MTLNCYKFKYYPNFALLHIFGRQQRLNECRIVIDEIAVHWKYFSTMYSLDYVDIAGLSYARSLQSKYSERNAMAVARLPLRYLGFLLSLLVTGIMKLRCRGQILCIICRRSHAWDLHPLVTQCLICTASSCWLLLGVLFLDHPLPNHCWRYNNFPSTQVLALVVYKSTLERVFYSSIIH